MAFGPIQVLVVGFEEGRFEGEILSELQRLREAEVIRIVDLLFLRCDENGEVDIIELSDLPANEQRELGAIAGALIGYGAAGEDGALLGAVAGAEAPPSVWDEADELDLAEALEPGEAVALALIEHRWAIPLRGAIQRAGGRAIAESWIQPEDLVALGADVAAQMALLEEN
jgi:uncharacterized membrane protein